MRSLLGIGLCLMGIAHAQLSDRISEEYNEDLTLRNLPDGKLLAHFEFNTRVNAHTQSNAPLLDYGLYPKAIGEVLQSFNVREMHLSFTQGRWNYEEWEYPPTLSAGTGVELWAWLKDTQDIDDQWKSLTNTLSGLFCASLNFIDETITTEPRLLFQSEEMRHEQLRYGSLPHENVCTENLTPWIKLLPCKSKSGISVLLNPHRIYNSNFHSMAIHAKSICMNDACTERQLELKQTVTSVMDPIRDSSRRDWSLASVFDRQLRQACPVANQSRVSVDLTNAGNEYELKPAGQQQGNAVTYHLSKEPLDIRMDWRQSSFDYPLEPVQPIIYAERYFTGYGQEHGGLKVTIHNRNQLEAMPVIYYDSLPWYLKLYLHTLKIDHPDVEVKQIYYQPAIDRGRPNTIECELMIPANTTVTLSLEFDKVFLKYTEHRPDANRGFDVGSAIITAWLPSSQSMKRIYTDTLLVRLPTPDFSMPYNVITLTCTVIALFFGSLFNLLIRNFTVLNDACN
ncbi:GPI transamidase component PIG-T [Gilbertella persicaria]|uniref:GPI transamidase component PIG-T n=1 Tax=Gilbertella persicaria TaxID=101096 RepID=UPI00221F0179|nr:GPI transamidase component PIG-T [Gilbertella persicaria]KAI8082676.1 GPI transamidase component PIG-T [Gilbertella persicaria]